MDGMVIFTAGSEILDDRKIVQISTLSHEPSFCISPSFNYYRIGKVGIGIPVNFLRMEEDGGRFRNEKIKKKKKRL